MKQVILFAALTLAFPAAVAAPDEEGEALFKQKTCISCHGPNGKKPRLPGYPKIGGQIAAYTEKQIKEIKNGIRTNGQTAAMRGVTHLVNDDEIRLISIWLESQK
ncbi:MAG: cytochrome c [Azoarcus sp.]|jgi:cytochrome c|nr:cytochrome c [Azoarcus sp.]